MKYPSETREVQCRQGKVGYMLTRKPVKILIFALNLMAEF